MLNLNIALETGLHSAPKARQIADALITDIRRGRISAGKKLPGTRALATSLGVSRGTIVAAMADLEAQGWLTTIPTRGTFIAEQLVPDENFKRSETVRHRLGFDLPDTFFPTGSDVIQALPRGVISLSSGTPDPRLVPVEDIARAYRRVLKRSGSQVLGYGHPQGHPALRSALADLLSQERGLVASLETVLITRGSQMALDVCARTLLQPGDVVAVEHLGYRPAWDALRMAGAHVVSIPVDSEGLNVDALEALVRRQRVRAVYVTPHHQYPTTATLSASRRVALLELARRHRIAILEDDYDHEFHYEGRPVLPLGSIDSHGLVISIGTLSKILAPGLRIGFVSAPQPLIARMTAVRRAMDRQGDLGMEAAIAELIEDGLLQRHVRKMRMVYRQRRDALAAALTKSLGKKVTFELPRGGISIWANAHNIDVEAWARRCETRGVHFSAGRRYAFDGRALDSMRLVFAPVTPAEIQKAIDIMVKSL